MNRFTLPIAVVLVLFVGICTTRLGITDEKKGEHLQLIIGAGSVSGVYFSTAGAICREVNHAMRKTGELHAHCSVEPTAGSVENLFLLADRELALGIVQSDVVGQAWEGLPPFVQKLKQLRSIVSLYSEIVTFVTKAGSGLKKLKDIQGKRLSLGTSGSGSQRSAMEIMRACAISTNDVKLVDNLSSDAAALALQKGEIDVYAYVVGHPNENIWSAASNMKVSFIDLADPCLDQLVKSNPPYVKTVIPGGIYPGIPQDTPSLAVKATLLTTADLPEDVVYQITKTVVEKLYRFKKLHPDFLAPNTKTLFEGLVAPLHVGAFRYFQELRVLEIKNGGKDPEADNPGVLLKPDGDLTLLRLGDEGPFRLSKALVHIRDSQGLDSGLLLDNPLAAATISGGVVHWLVVDDEKHGQEG